MYFANRVKCPDKKTTAKVLTRFSDAMVAKGRKERAAEAPLLTTCGYAEKGESSMIAAEMSKLLSGYKGA